ncbi:ribosome maturation factor RimP [Nocardia tenerifensis]|uniref:Ribosome maturation factor RimP n=1 Tax=Nocardia tenerifensis TaxID=228006 RepID=A0A318KN70_9NOCA|nr:ribosome maturation factor RimP [Nocardia tenerifensis]PXX63885.1 ribosome maturation factor RimP [Nocardia tenerifensis]
MPMPTEERLSQLIAGLVERRGFDLEGVEISTTGKHRAAAQEQELGDQSARVKVTVDSDGPSDLDALAAVSTELSELLDEAGDFGETPYLLEVSTPGVDRPLTADRHWRRARGRKVRVRLREGAQPPEPGGPAEFEARVGELGADTVALVLGGRRKPRLVRVPVADIAEAVVQVEFGKPGAEEWELAGGVAPGRPVPGQEIEEPAVDAADVRGSTPLLPESVTASDSPTEGIVE